MESLIDELRKAAKESFIYSDLLRKTADTLADVQPVVHGEWEEVDNVIFLCSECKHASGRTPFCAWCGAKMDGGT